MMGAERVRDDGHTMTDTLSDKAAQLAAQWKEYMRRVGARVPRPLAPLSKLVQE
jgi:hypothetical protein